MELTSLDVSDVTWKLHAPNNLVNGCNMRRNDLCLSPDDDAVGSSTLAREIWSGGTILFFELQTIKHEKGDE